MLLSCMRFDQMDEIFYLDLTGNVLVSTAFVQEYKRTPQVKDTFVFKGHHMRYSGHLGWCFNAADVPDDVALEANRRFLETCFNLGG